MIKSTMPRARVGNLAHPSVNLEGSRRSSAFRVQMLNIT